MAGFHLPMQIPLQNLACRILGQRFDEFDRLRCLKGSETIFAERNDLLVIKRRTGLRHDTGFDRFAPMRVGSTDRRGLHNGNVTIAASVDPQVSRKIPSPK